jgi:translocation and assembly module TamB
MDDAARPAASSPSPDAGPPAAPRWRLWLRRCLWVGLGGPLLLALLAVLAAAAFAAWSLGSEAGNRWWAERATGLAVQRFEGTLLSALGGQPWIAHGLRWQDTPRPRADGSPADPLWIEFDSLRVQGLRWTWRPDGDTWLGLEVDTVASPRLHVHTGAPGTVFPRPLPKTLAFPVRVAAGSVSIGRIEVNEARPIVDFAAQQVLWQSTPGAEHRVQALVASGFGIAARAQVRVANTAPYALEALVDLAPLAAPATAPASPPLPPWTAQLKARGPVAQIALDGTLASPAANAGEPAQRLTLAATAQPLLAWPIARLSAEAEALDLAALAGAAWAQAPSTRLSGRLALAVAAANAPAQLEIDLRNARPGRWDTRRLPIAALAASARSSLAERDRIVFESLQAELADAEGPAGQLRAQGQWWLRDAVRTPAPGAAARSAAIELDATLRDLAPHRLDRRAAAMTLSGPMALRFGRAANGADKSARKGADWWLDLRTVLDGTLAAAPQPVKLKLDAFVDPRELVLRELVAEAGRARATLVGRYAGATAQIFSGPWQASSEGRIEQFDPVPWWPGAEGAAWRRGPHRVNAQWQFDVRGPGGLPGGLVPATPAAPEPPTAMAAPTPGGAWLAWAQRLAGSGRIAWSDSLLAGVSTQGDLSLGYRQVPAPRRAAAGAVGPETTPTQATLMGDATLGGNRLRFTGQGDPAGAGRRDRIAATLDAPDLATLKPLAALHPALAGTLPAAGRVLAEAELLGRWPELHTEGRASVQGLVVAGTAPATPTLALAQAQLDWQIDTAADTVAGTRATPLALNLAARGVQAAGQAIDGIDAKLDGTLAEHRLAASMTLPYTPAPALQKAFGLPDDRRTRAALRGVGRWQPEAAGGGTWRGALEQLTLAGHDSAEKPAASGSSNAASTWLETGALNAELGFGPGGRWQWARADPGRLVLGNTLRLRWDAIEARRRGEQVHWGVRAELESFAVAPLLTRTQPGLGWGGDLRLAGRIQVDAGERFAADVRIERLDGDLTVNRGEGLQLLGLSDLLLRVQAQDGMWSISPRLRGRGLGEIDGSLRVQTDPTLRWPAPQAALQGAVEARVRDIGIWAPWMPPGWRLAGEVQTRFRVDGAFSEPRYDGELSGQGIAVRHLLQGINVSDGNVKLRLQGDRAVIERFTLKGGDGTLVLTGEAVLPVGERAGSGAREPAARIVAKAERFRVIGRVDRLLTASGEATLGLQGDRAGLEAKLRIDEGQIDISRGDAPSLDDDVQVKDSRNERQAAAAAAATAAAEGNAPPPNERLQALMRNFMLDAQVDLGEALKLKGRGIDTELRGKLRFTSPGGRLAIDGTVNTERGTYAGYAQKLDIDRGAIVFGGPPANPRLDILALRPNLDVRVGVLITGSAQSPRVRLFSEPAMGEQETLSWLMLGRASDGLGRNDIALLQRAAVALLAGEGEAPTEQLLRNLGIDELSISQREGDVRDTVVTIGKQLGRRWYLGYERGVNATAGTWQLTYRVAQRFTVRAQSGVDSSLDLIWVRRIGETDENRMRKSVSVPP